MRSYAIDFYIYALIDEYDNPFYVGYGRKNRFKEHWRDFMNGRETNNFKNKVFVRLQSKGLEYRVDFIENNLSFTDALEREKFHINRLGTRYDNTGLLCNLTKGGDGGYTPNNRNFGNDPIMKAKLMEHIDRNIRGKPLQTKHIESLRKAALGREVHGMKDKFHSSESRAIISQKMKGNSNNVGKYKPQTAQLISNGISRYKAIEDKRVIAVNLENKILFVFNNQVHAFNHLLLPNKNCISAVIWGKQKTAHGFIFYYFNKLLIRNYVKSGFKMQNCQNY